MTRRPRPSKPSESRALERAANEWAAAQGARLPQEDDGRLLGDSRQTSEQLRGLKRRREEARIANSVREQIKADLTVARSQEAAIKARIRQLELDDRLLALQSEGSGVSHREIADQFGRGRTWATEQLGRILAQYLGRTQPPVDLLPCARRACKNEVARYLIAGLGRPAQYCSDRCRAAEASRRRRARQSAARAEQAATTTASGSSPTGSPARCLTSRGVDAVLGQRLLPAPPAVPPRTCIPSRQPPQGMDPRGDDDHDLDRGPK